MSESKTILIVEDDSGIREALQLALEMEGYRVFTAANGKEGIEMLSNIQNPGLILLDLMMPVMNGLEFAQALFEDKMLSTIPIVAVTAYVEKATAIKNIQSIIKKPVELNLLLATTKQYCG